jgi:hypothetical protein
MDAGLAALEERIPEARAGFEEAMRRYRELDLPYQLGAAAISMVYALGAEDPGARAIVDEGRAIFERLGSPPLLRILEQGAARLERAEGEPVPGRSVALSSEG